MKKGYIFLLLSIIFWGCQDTKSVEPMVGGACSYKDYANSIEIVSLLENNATQECEKSVDIKYEVVRKAQDLPVTPRGTITYRVSKEYLVTKGFDIGSVHDMNISVIISGTCTPVIEKIIGIDETDFRQHCQE